MCDRRDNPEIMTRNYSESETNSADVIRHILYQGDKHCCSLLKLVLKRFISFSSKYPTTSCQITIVSVLILKI